MVMWAHNVPLPSREWIRDKVPLAVKKVLLANFAPKQDGLYGDGTRAVEATAGGRNQLLSVRTAMALFLNITSGYCYGIGLMYAGTSDAAAKDTLLDQLLWLQRMRDNKPYVKEFGFVTGFSLVMD